MEQRRKDRRPTIVSPVIHIRSYDRRNFVTLVLIACLLASVAGYINVLCLQSLIRMAVSATTGMTTRMVIAFADGQSEEAFNLTLSLLFFVCGSVVSGALVGASSFRLQRSYSIVLLLETCFVTASYVCLVMSICSLRRSFG